MKESILILHGWGSTMSGSRYQALQKILEKKGYTVFAPDLPGFGENKLKKDELFFADYVSFVKDFLQQKKLKRVILLGHSFGGRIAIAFTALYPESVSKLVLVNASGIVRPLPSLKKKAVYFITKLSKPIFGLPGLSHLYKFFRKAVYYSIGEMDYYNAKSLAKTFTNIYRVSIVEQLSKISVPTLIVWGENDTMTPLADGKLMRQKIKDSTFIVVKGATHRLPYENPDVFAQEVLKFIQ